MTTSSSTCAKVRCRTAPYRAFPRVPRAAVSCRELPRRAAPCRDAPCRASPSHAHSLPAPNLFPKSGTNRVQMLVLVLCSSLSFFCTMVHVSTAAAATADATAAAAAAATAACTYLTIPHRHAQGLAYICSWDNSLQRNVVWILIADSVSSFSRYCTLLPRITTSTVAKPKKTKPRPQPQPRPYAARAPTPLLF